MRTVLAALVRLRTRVTYANLMATAAVFLALGGVGYAAGAVPNDSVGRDQIRPGAVGRAQLAPNSVGTQQLARRSVTRRRLSFGLRHRIDQRPKRGPRGPRGPKGADGVGARRLNYDAAAQASPAYTTILQTPALRLRAACVAQGGDVSISMKALTSENTIGQDNFTFDTGSDPHQPGTGGGGNLQIDFAANVEKDLGGVGSQGGSGYGRAIATVVLAGARNTTILVAATIANADTQRCSITGSAAPAS